MIISIDPCKSEIRINYYIKHKQFLAGLIEMSAHNTHTHTHTHVRNAMMYALFILFTREAVVRL